MIDESYNYFEQLKYFAAYCDDSIDDMGKFDGCNEILFDNLQIDSYLHDFRLKYSLNRFMTDNEEEIVFRIVRWVFEILLHTDYAADMIDYNNSKDMITKSRNDKVKLNCYCHAYILRDALQSVGIITRIVYCLPINCDYFGNHVVVEYFSNSQNKWILVDPTYNVFFADHKGNLLNIVELRKKVISCEEIVIVDNNRFTFKNKHKGIELCDYLKMIIPILIVLQYESVSGHCIHHYRLLPCRYLVPVQEIEIDSISYIHSYKSLYCSPIKNKGETH